MRITGSLGEGKKAYPSGKSRGGSSKRFRITVGSLFTEKKVNHSTKKQKRDHARASTVSCTMHLLDHHAAHSTTMHALNHHALSIYLYIYLLIVVSRSLTRLPIHSLDHPPTHTATMHSFSRSITQTGRYNWQFLTRHLVQQFDPRS